MASFGGVAVGERRTGGDHPARSAILGLVAACLGITRAEQPRLDALSAGLGVALRRLGRDPPLLTDYHTAQSAPTTARGIRPRTRREELARPDVGTILTRRDYRTDAAFTLALWRRTGAPDEVTLDGIAAALEQPRFVPSFGRKCCPLSLPMAPRIVAVPTVFEAFAARDAAAELPERRLFGSPRVGTVFADEPGKGEPPLGGVALAQVTRRDAPLDRSRWQFALRTELRVAWSPAA